MVCSLTRLRDRTGASIAETYWYLLGGLQMSQFPVCAEAGTVYPLYISCLGSGTSFMKGLLEGVFYLGLFWGFF